MTNIFTIDSVEMIKNFFNGKVIKITNGKDRSYCYLCGKDLGIYIDKGKAICSQCFEKMSVQLEKLKRCQENDESSIKKPDKKQYKRQRMLKKNELNQLLLFTESFKVKRTV